MLEDLAEFETSFTEEVVCPYCGYEYQNSYELDLPEGGMSGPEKIECEECGKEFLVSMDLQVSYSTRKGEE